MFDLFSSIVALGTKNEHSSAVQKTRMLNMLVLLTILIAIVYSVSYMYVLNEPLVALFNLVLTSGYFLSLFFSYQHHHKAAKTWYFSLIMLHLFVCGNLFFTQESGFHFYYFLVPIGALLLFELKEKKLKTTLSLVAASLFLYCENTLNENPLHVFSEAANHLLSQSAFLVDMFAIILALTLFSKQIEKHELGLIKQASTDMLTGLNNRRFFFQEGEKLLTKKNKENKSYSLLLIDLDYFKNINDKYGHAVGDECLIIVSNALQNMGPENKLCARIGGEEFAIILPRCGPKSAEVIAEHVRSTIERVTLTTSQGNFVECSGSIGISYNVAKNETLKELLEQADVALYKAKDNGRNQVVSFHQLTHS